MSMMVSQITGVFIACSIVGSGADQRKHQSFASLPFVWGINRWPGHMWLVNSPHKRPVMQKMFPFYDIIIMWSVFSGLNTPIILLKCALLGCLWILTACILKQDGIALGSKVPLGKQNIELSNIFRLNNFGNDFLKYSLKISIFILIQLETSLHFNCYQKQC